MAQFQNDPFPGTDYTKYLEWAKVTTPDGNTFYEVPGHPGYVLDPVATNATGRKVFRANPKSKVEEYNAQQEAQKQAQFMQGPLGQLLPVAASVGGLYAANQLIPAASNPLQEALAAKVLSSGATTAAATPAAAAAQGATGAAISGAAPAVTGEAGVAGAVAPSSYGLLTGNVAGTGLGVLPLAGIAAGTYLGGKSLLNMIQGKADNSLQGKAGRVISGMATGGLSEVARHFLMKPSTRDIAKEHTSQLQEQAPEDTNWQNYVGTMRQQYNEAPTDPSKPFAGKYSSWDEYKKGGLEAGDLTGVYGNLKTFGPEWANLTQEQRQAVTQGLINNNLYDSKKGEVIVTDEKKAQDVKNNILKGFQVGQSSSTPVAKAPIATVQATLPNNVTPVTTIPTQPGASVPVTTPAQAAAQGYFRKIPIKVK